MVVEGVTYDWEIEADPLAGSVSFSHRGLNTETVRITGDDGSRIAFIRPGERLHHRGWWRGSFQLLSEEVIERAIRIARGDPSTKDRWLDDAAVEEAFHGPRRTLTDELHHAGAALASWDTEALVESLLGVGCSGNSLEEWISRHADQLRAAPLPLLLDVKGEPLYRNRSAIAFLIEACERMKISLGVDTTQVDAALKARQRFGMGSRMKPWGIPHSHWWWPEFIRDPYDDD